MTCFNGIDPTVWLLSAGMMIGGIGMFVSGAVDLFVSLRGRKGA